MQLKVTVNGVPYKIEVEVEEQQRRRWAPSSWPGGASAHPRHSVGSRPRTASAPLSGAVARVLVEEGEEIKEGQVVVVLEAMKMETEITAPRSGTISAVLVAAGEAVSGGQVLVELE